MNSVVIRRYWQKVWILAKLDVTDLCLVSTTSVNSNTGWLLLVHSPQSDDCTLLTSSCEQITRSIQSHSCDWTLMAGKYNLKFYILETSNFDKSFFSVRQRENRWSFVAWIRVKRTEAIWIIASVKTIDQGQICEIIDIYLHLQHYHDPIPHTNKHVDSKLG